MRLTKISDFVPHDKSTYTIKFEKGTDLHLAGTVYKRAKLYLKAAGFVCFSYNDREGSVNIDSEQLSSGKVVVTRD